MAKLRGMFSECLSDAEDFIFGNEASFLANFVFDHYADLTGVSFTSHGVKIVAVTSDGQHVTYTIEAHRYNDWADKVRTTTTLTIGE